MKNFKIFVLGLTLSVIGSAMGQDGDSEGEKVQEFKCNTYLDPRDSGTEIVILRTLQKTTQGNVETRELLWSEQKGQAPKVVVQKAVQRTQRAEFPLVFSAKDEEVVLEVDTDAVSSDRWGHPGRPAFFYSEFRKKVVPVLCSLDEIDVLVR